MLRGRDLTKEQKGFVEKEKFNQILKRFCQKVEVQLGGGKVLLRSKGLTKEQKSLAMEFKGFVEN